MMLNVPNWFAFMPLDTMKDAVAARLQAIAYYGRQDAGVGRVAVSSKGSATCSATTTRFPAVGLGLTCLRSSSKTRPGHHYHTQSCRSRSRVFIPPTHGRLAGNAPSRLLKCRVKKKDNPITQIRADGTNGSSVIADLCGSRC